MANINMDNYKKAIRLEEPFAPAMSDIDDKAVLAERVLLMLRNEKAGTQDIDIPEDYTAQRKLIRALLNIRQPLPLDKEMMQLLDKLLHIEKEEKEKISPETIRSIQSEFPKTRFKEADKMALWQGDITNIEADAIVNAANEKLLGCMQPLHGCIDNVIHSAAGPMLRDDGAEIIHRQKTDEEAGNAKITRGYHLPAKYVIHTVGPALSDGEEVLSRHEETLVSSYRSCLDIAQEKGDVKTLVFPAISTGEFNFPEEHAAEIAVWTVDEWLKTHEHHFTKVIFNVFTEADKAIYEAVLNA
ncbi:protein-ADP-ribose hydrolase [Salinicoccus siamensis]|uniref:Protein-ADP-ribose hydrolase n=1 Tax=Salinicoccus siamensis TaxID=381830 RepID=A0ABV5Z4F7_9STAP